jgi:hypothetical protein
VKRLERDFHPGPPEALDVIAVSAVAAAMAAFVPDADSWQRGEPVIRTVQIHLGEVAFSLRNGDVPAPVHTDILARLVELADDPFQRIALEEQLLRQFAHGCAVCGLPFWFPLAPRALLDFVFRDHGVTIASLGEVAFGKTLFESIPEADVIDASQAPSFIVALESFLHFMKAYGLPQADELLRVVGEGATERLEALVRAVSPGWVPRFTHPVDMAPPRARTDRAARRARGSSSKRR